MLRTIVLVPVYAKNVAAVYILWANGTDCACLTCIQHCLGSTDTTYLWLGTIDFGQNVVQAS